jgi:outer membrane protein
MKRQEDLGLKGPADVAQIEAQVAGDDYVLTHQQNLCNTALIKLKEYMNYPYGEDLAVDTTAVDGGDLFAIESVTDIYGYALVTNPAALQAAFQVKTSKMQYLIQRGKLFPTITLSAGLYTSYYENLKSEQAPAAFRNQFNNNQGKAVSLNMRIPLFDGLATVTNVRRARNNMRIAQEKQVEVQQKLQADIAQAVADRDGFAKESLQMSKKLQADEIAYRVTLRKFEEGLMSPLDVQTSANILLESRANLLQRQLMYSLKRRLVDYYKGSPLVN